eukprot:Nitzschia sp. Nitz4//scaffold121_size67750//13507//16399//NITZ4_006063-RA/size67750-processed-gene-0.16-mRNA-1//-1//CDS//3329534336//4697//frame0
MRGLVRWITPFFIGLLALRSVLVKPAELVEECSADDTENCPTSYANPFNDWVEGMGGTIKQFLQDKVFGQEIMNQSVGEDFLSLFKSGSWDSNTMDKAMLMDFFQGLSDIDPFGLPETSDEANTPPSGELVQSLLERVGKITEGDKPLAGSEFFNVLRVAMADALDQLKLTFGDLMDEMDPFVLLSMMYFVVHEDTIKTPSWKRRQHRFHQHVSKEVILELHDALYMAHLAYVNTVEEFRSGLQAFRNNEWELAYGTTESLPHMPAHFLLVHKNLSPLLPVSRLPWESTPKTELTVALVVRGTKHLTDAIADALLTPVEYRGGYAHGGILENGRSLATRYVSRLKTLLDHSGRDKLRLYLIGHSLGAGAAAIAAMELNDLDWIEVEAVGFGCPALLSSELSVATKDYVTTVVSDADIIPRMSGSSIANLMLDLLEFDWTALALEDLEHTISEAEISFPLSGILPTSKVILKAAKDFIESQIKPRFSNKERQRIPNVLIPPGNCIHFYRDGVSYSGVFTPCSFFNSVDMARTYINMSLPPFLVAFLSAQYPFASEIQALGIAFQGAVAVRAGANKDKSMHWFHAFALTTVTAFGGGWLGFLLMGKPTSMVSSGDINVPCCLLAFLVVNYTPYDVGYKLLNWLPIKIIITMCAQMFRSNGMMKFIKTAFAEVSPSPYYPIPLIGPILYGTMLGNMGGLVMKGFDGYLKNGIPWNFQNGMFIGTFFHLFAHDKEGPLGVALRAIFKSVSGGALLFGLDDMTFATVATSAFMQVAGLLKLPQFLGPDYNPIVDPVFAVGRSMRSVVTPPVSTEKPTPQTSASIQDDDDDDDSKTEKTNAKTASKKNKRKKKKVA